MCPERNNQEWLSDLREQGPRRDGALSDLRIFLKRGLAYAFSGRGVASSSIEDFAQEALMRILERLESFRSEGRFTTWALTIAVHVAFTEMRRQHWKDVSLEEMTREAGLPSGSFVAEAKTPEKRILQERIVATLYRAIRESLTEKQRQAVYAEIVNEAPVAEIARRMGTTRNALYKLSHDARRRLRKTLSEGGLSREDLVFALDL